MTILVQLAMTFGVLSILSIGGANATIPEIHRQVVLVHHWMDDTTFATLVAIGQSAPGPNVLIVSMIGWHIAGIFGLLAASLAIVLPSSLIALGVGRCLAVYQGSQGVVVVRRALAPIALGFMFASSIVMTQAAYQGRLSLAIVAAVAAIVYFTRISPVWSIAGGGALSIVAHRLHLFG